jgi:hypothetical protein
MRRRGKPLEISTFPFLAVLLCAMGSLILVLIVMDRKAKMAARYKATAAQAQAAEDLAKAEAAHRALLQEREAEASAVLEQKRNDLHTAVLSQQQLVQAQMKKVQEELKQAALRLKAELDETGELKERGESERAELAAQEKALAATRQALQQAEATTAADRAAKAKITADLLQLETMLKDLMAARERDRQTYSVVPYHGKHGENRRPLYLECTRNGIIFQPDNVEMALGANAGKVRAEVLRRIQRQKEYLASIQAKTDDKPYFMLLVRPDGITSYYELQSAVRDLDVEFGYEFVDAGWVFDFPSEPHGAPAKSPIVGAPQSGTPSPSRAGSSPAIAMLPPEKVGGTGPGNNGSGGPKGSGSGSVVGPGAGSGTAQAQGGRQVPVAGELSGPAAAEVNAGGSSAPPVIPTIPYLQSPRTGGPVSPGRGEPGVHSSKTATDFAMQGPHRGQSDMAAVAGGAGVGDLPAGSSNSRPGTEVGTGRDVLGRSSPGGGLPGPVLPPGAMGSAQSGAPPAGQPVGPANPSGQKPPTSASTPLPVPASPGGSTRGAEGTAASDTENPSSTKDTAPRFAPPQTTPPVKKQPPPLRVARLNGDRDYIIFVECRPETVVLYPSQQSFSVQQLARGDQALVQAVKQMIDRKQALVRPGELPFRPQIRYLVHAESIRSYHTTYPVLNALGVPQTRQNLEADDDVAAIVVGQ